MIDQKRNDDELREVCPVFLELQELSVYEPISAAESQGPGEASPVLSTDRVDCVYLVSFGCFHYRHRRGIFLTCNRRPPSFDLPLN